MVPILVVQGNVSVRKAVRSSLERAGYAVMVVGSVGEAAARLRLLDYDVVVCNDRQRSTKWSEDYEQLLDARHPPVRADATHELHLPRAELKTLGVLLMPGSDPAALQAAIEEALRVLSREGAASSEAPRA